MDAITIQPAFFIPHGGGPCFFMDDPHGIWTGMAAFLRSLPGRLPRPPSALLVISGHWQAESFTLTGAEHNALIYDYYNFPPHTYELRYDAPGAPALAAQATALLQASQLPARIDASRGLDHGVFIPLKVAFPGADIPVLQMSLRNGLDPAVHIEAGRALAPLRDAGVLILGSGMSFHNMRGYGDPRFTAPSQQFDSWLAGAVALPGPARGERLRTWEAAPSARLCHPQEEHLLPLMVAAGASPSPGEKLYSEIVLQTAISGFGFV